MSRAVAGSATKIRDLRILGIVVSMGGPPTIARFLNLLPKTLPIPICIVQHTTKGCTEPLVHWLNAACAMPCLIATEGTELHPGHVFVAPDGVHMEVAANGKVHLSNAPLQNSLRPAGDILLASIARAYGARGAGLVCTGLGHDGRDGLAAIAKAGGMCWAQDPATAVAKSMPECALNAVSGCVRVNLDILATALGAVR